jgi:hypothetical protein
MTEIDVALSDFAIAVECGGFAVLCLRRGRSRFRDALIVVFVATAAAAVLGGVVHGFAADEASAAYRLLWPVTLAAIVAAAAGLAFAAAALLDSGRRVVRGLWAGTFGFVAAILLGADSFLLAVAAYAPASLFLAYAFGVTYGREGRRPLAFGPSGLLLGIVAGGLQQAGYTPWPGAISHNAFYHLLQMAALAMLFVAGRAAGPAQIPMSRLPSA